MNTTTDGLRKAAILVDTLDAKTADALLGQMAEEQADQVRRAVLHLGQIDPEERHRVVAEFLRNAPDVKHSPPSGIELDGRLAERLLDRGRSSGGSAGPSASTPFGRLRQAEQTEISRVLAGEPPQTIALVLSHLPPAQAGAVLALFPADLQTEVVRRLVDLEETDPEILREVERGLEARLAQIPLARRRVAGAAAVDGILKATEKSASRQILENLSRRDPRLASRFVPARPEVNPIAFEDLAGFSGAALAVIAETAEPELLTLALVGAPPILTDRLLRQLPHYRSRAIWEQLHHPAPTRLSDVEEARAQLAELAYTLVADGKIEVELPEVAGSTLQVTA